MLSMLLGVDPGSVCGGLVLVVLRDGRPQSVSCPLGPRPEMREIVRFLTTRHPQGCGVVMELLQGGRILSRDVIETALWSGRLIQAAVSSGLRVRGYTRSKVKATLLGRVTGNDAAVRAWVSATWCTHPDAQLDAREPAVGTKREPGPLYGVTRDAWSALAVVHASLMCEPSEEWEG